MQLLQFATTLWAFATARHVLNTVGAFCASMKGRGRSRSPRRPSSRSRSPRRLSSPQGPRGPNAHLSLPRPVGPRVFDELAAATTFAEGSPQGPRGPNAHLSLPRPVGPARVFGAPPITFAETPTSSSSMHPQPPRMPTPPLMPAGTPTSSSSMHPQPPRMPTTPPLMPAGSDRRIFDDEGELMLGRVRRYARALLPMAAVLRDDLVEEMLEGELRVEPQWSTACAIHTLLTSIAFQSHTGRDWTAIYYPNDPDKHPIK